MLELKRAALEADKDLNAGEVDTLEEARKVVRDLRQKTRAQAQQLLAWRRAYKTQVISIYPRGCPNFTIQAFNTFVSFLGATHIETATREGRPTEGPFLKTTAIRIQTDKEAKRHLNDAEYA